MNAMLYYTLALILLTLRPDSLIMVGWALVLFAAGTIASREAWVTLYHFMEGVFMFMRSAIHDWRQDRTGVEK